MIKKLDILNSDEKFIVNNVFCIGRNYVDHINEFKNKEISKQPVVFVKPNNSIASSGEKIEIPEYCGQKISDDLQNEVELVIAIKEDCNNVSEYDASRFILGYAIGIDFTLRDLQTIFKEKGLPFGVSKGFRTSSPVSDIILKADIPDPMNLEIELVRNGDIIQKSNTSLMIFNINTIVSYISCTFGLSKGDLIFTGTPKGIRKLNSGDLLEAKLDKYLYLEVRIA
ncbi:fumarylacetoacetate hydrolase family protein [soil metagenome]